MNKFCFRTRHDSNTIERSILLNHTNAEQGICDIWSKHFSNDPGLPVINLVSINNKKIRPKKKRDDDNESGELVGA